MHVGLSKASTGNVGQESLAGIQGGEILLWGMRELRLSGEEKVCWFCGERYICGFCRERDVFWFCGESEVRGFCGEIKIYWLLGER